jgi:hypothetical protein
MQRGLILNSGNYVTSLLALQAYKFLYSKRLAECGLPAEAIHYVEVIAGSILQQPTNYTASFIKEVYELGNQLKYHDPVYSSGEGEGVELTDPLWLHSLYNVIHSYNVSTCMSHCLTPQCHRTFNSYSVLGTKDI